jgi:myosin V
MYAFRGRKHQLSNELKDTNAKQKRQSVASSFKQQLDDLMNTVGLSDPHFIRCIKPNSQCVPKEFNPLMVTEQLRYGGVLQSVQVSRHGYPVRLKHIDFLLSYRCLSSSRVFNKPPLKMDSTEIEKAVGDLLDDLVHQHECFSQFLETRQTVIGKTLVFFKQAAYNTLTDARARLRVQMATRISSIWLGTLQRRHYLHLKACTLIIQVINTCTVPFI